MRKNFGIFKLFSPKNSFVSPHKIVNQNKTDEIENFAEYLGFFLYTFFYKFSLEIVGILKKASLVALVPAFLVGCQSILKKRDLEFINEYYSSRTFFVKENIPIGNKSIIEQGTSVKVLIEASSSVIKVKCFPSNQEREGSIGRMVAYIVNEDIKNKNFTVEDLEELISQKLSSYYISQKSPKGKKK